MRRVISMVVVALLVTACAGQGQTAEEFVEVSASLGDGEDAAAPETTVAAADEGDGELAQVDLDVGDRRVIHNARLRLRAGDTRDAFDRIVATVEASGGFVAQATISPIESEEDQPEVSMVLRIPSARLTAAMSEIKDIADEVISQSQEARDVTEEFIDLEARLTNLRTLETELRALLGEVRAQPNADPDELLRVFQEIASVRGQIEQIQGQLNYLDDVVSLATLEVSLVPTPAAVPIVEDTWRPVEVARDALRSLVVGLQDVADVVIAFVLFTLPMLLVTVGIPGGAFYLAYRTWRKRRPAPTPTTTEP